MTTLKRLYTRSYLFALIIITLFIAILPRTCFAWSNIPKDEIKSYVNRIQVYFVISLSSDTTVTFPHTHITYRGTSYNVKRLEADTINYFKGAETLPPHPCSPFYGDSLFATNKIGIVWKWVVENSPYVVDDALYMSIWDHSCDTSHIGANLLNPDGGIFFNIEYQKMDGCNNPHIIIFDNDTTFQSWTGLSYGMPVWKGWDFQTPINSFFVERWGWDELFFARDSIAIGGGAKIKLTLRHCRAGEWDHWDTGYPILRDNYPQPIDLKKYNQRNLTWTQNDITIALLLELQVTTYGDGRSYWLTYCPNGYDAHIGDTLCDPYFVDMSPTPWCFNKDTTYSNRDIIKDLKKTIHSSDTIHGIGVTALRIAHFSNSGLSWQSRVGQDCGGTVKNIIFGNQHNQPEGAVAHTTQEYSNQLLTNQPNPFTKNTKLSFQIKEPGKVSLTIYNIMGQSVRTLINNNLSAGNHTVVWDGTNDAGDKLSTGAYFYKLKASDFEETKKINLLR